MEWDRQRGALVWPDVADCGDTYTGVREFGVCREYVGNGAMDMETRLAKNVGW